MAKTQQEMLDAVYVREAVVEIRRYAKQRVGYALAQAFLDTIDDKASTQTELTKVTEARARAIQKVEDRYQPKMGSLRKILDDILKENRSWTNEVLRVSAPFFATWIIQEVKKTGKVEDVLFNSKRNLVSEYAKAWIKGWRPVI